MTPKTITITLGDQSYPLAFSFNGIGKIENDFDMSYLDVYFSAKWTLGLIYRGIEDGCRLKEKEFNLTREQIGDLIFMDKALIEKVWSYWNEVISWGQVKSEGTEEEEGKKKEG